MAPLLAIAIDECNVNECVIAIEPSSSLVTKMYEYKMA